MSTQAQIAANRLNAQLSTGPSTSEGKQASSQNARTHGFTSTILQVAPDQQPFFDRLETELRETVNPAPGLEQELFRQLVTSAWQLRRLAQWEEELLDQPNPFEDVAAEARLGKLNRYKSAHQRTFDRALSEIRHLQSVRVALEQIEPNARPAVVAKAPLARLSILLKALKAAAKGSTNLQPQAPPASAAPTCA
jgi:hypothetical protein